MRERVRDIPDPFEGLRTQGEVNRMLGETPGEELDEDFIARRRARLEDTSSMLLRDLGSIQEEERQWDEAGHYAAQDPEDVRAYILAEEVDAILDRRLVRRLGLVERALEKINGGPTASATLRGSGFRRGSWRRYQRRFTP